MTVPSLSEASYKRLKFAKVNNGTKPTASPFPRIPPSGIALPQLGRDFSKQSLCSPAITQLSWDLEKNGSS